MDQAELELEGGAGDARLLASRHPRLSTHPESFIILPLAPAGSELHEDAPTQAYDLFSQFTL